MSKALKIYNWYPNKCVGILLKMRTRLTLQLSLQDYHNQVLHLTFWCSTTKSGIGKKSRSRFKSLVSSFEGWGMESSTDSIVTYWIDLLQDHDALVEGNAWHLDTAHAFNFFPGTNRWSFLIQHFTTVTPLLSIHVCGALKLSTVLNSLLILFPCVCFNSIEVLAVFKRGKKLPKKPVRKGSGVRSKSAKSLRFTKAGKRLAHLNERLGHN